MNLPHPLPTGLIAITGGERSGKTSLLRRLAGELPALPGEVPPRDAHWLDLALPGQDAHTAQEVWSSLRARWPHWDAGWQQQLVQALKLSVHEDKSLFMLSAGSRRKVALVGLLCSGAAVTCLDQPYAALDQASIRVVCAFLNDLAVHPSRSWVVADYEADPELPWRLCVALDVAPLG